MRKALFAIISPVLAAALLFSACAKPAEQPVTDVTATEAPAPEETAAICGDGYTVEVKTVYYPEGSDKDTAKFMLALQLPVFENTAMNEAITEYEDELNTRITSEQLPLSERTDSFIPNTKVELSVFRAELPQGEYTNIMFTETVSFLEDGESEHARHLIVMDSDGNEQSLASVSGLYSPEDTVAQQIWNIIADDGNYYSDLTQEDIEEHLDLYNGFSVGDEGYTVYLPAGAVADESMGEQEFSFGKSALYPDFVGDVITAEEYARILPMLNAAAAACGPDFASLLMPEGELGPAYCREYWLRGRDSRTVTKNEFLSAYGFPFSHWMPPVENSPGVEFVGDGTVKLTRVTPFYGFQPEDAMLKEDGTLTVTGVLMSGAPGTADAAAAASAAASFMKVGDEYYLNSFEIM